MSTSRPPATEPYRVDRKRCDAGCCVSVCIRHDHSGTGLAAVLTIQRLRAVAAQSPTQPGAGLSVAHVLGVDTRDETGGFR